MMSLGLSLRQLLTGHPHITAMYSYTSRIGYSLIQMPGMDRNGKKNWLHRVRLPIVHAISHCWFVIRIVKRT